MKILMPQGNWTFTPGPAGVGTIDFSVYPSFLQENLYAVINTSKSGNPIIFSTSGGASLGGIFSGGTTLTLNYDTSSMASGDKLQVIYDEPSFIQQVNGSVNVDTIPNSVMGFGIMTGPLQGSVASTYFDSASYVEAPPFKSFTTQVVATATASGNLIFEGSNNVTNWNTIFVYQVNDPQAIFTSGITVVGGTAQTYTGPINYRFIRARSSTGFGAGNIQLFTTFSQTMVDPSIPNRQMVDSAGRSLNYGAGVSSGSTLRVVTSDDSQVLQREVHISSASQTALNTNLMTGTSASYDVTGYRSIGIQIVGSAGISAGAVTWEGSNDNANWFTQILIPPDNSTPSPVTSNMVIGASSTRQLYGSLPFRYYRLRISTGFTGGSVTAQFRLSPNHIAGMTIPVIGTVTAALSAGAVTGATLSGALVGDISLGNITTATTTTSSSISISNTQVMAFNMNISVLSGTNAFQDTTIQSSLDGGTNWFDIYHFPRATAVGQFNTGPIKVIGNNIRYVRVTSGTGISITTSINRVSRQVDGPIYTAFFDRTIVPNTLNSTTSSYFVEGCDEFTMVVNMGAITTTAPAFQLEGSEDNVNFYSIGSPLTGVANSTVVLATGTSASAKWIRARVSIAGLGATLGYVSLKAKNI